MNLKFVKEKNEIKAYIVNNSKEMNFDYIEMIKILYNEKRIAKTKFDGNFTSEEKDSIERIVKEIEKIIKNKEAKINEE